MNTRGMWWLCLCGLGTVTCLASDPPTGEPVLVYGTSFDATEGYDPGKPLRGQQGWQAEGSGGNGLVEDFFEGWGQQGYIGYNPPAPKDEVLSVWRPLNAPKPTPAQPVWKFSVWMQLVDSTNGEYDDFR